MYTYYRAYNGDSDSENVRPTSFAELSQPPQQPRPNTQNNSQLQQQHQQQQQQIQQQIQQQLYDTPTKRPQEKKTATFADLPNQTTWRQQQQQQQQHPLNETIPTQGLFDCFVSVHLINLTICRRGTGDGCPAAQHQAQAGRKETPH